MKFKVCQLCGVMVLYGWLQDHVDYTHPQEYVYSKDWLVVSMGTESDGDWDQKAK